MGLSSINHKPDTDRLLASYRTGDKAEAARDAILAHGLGEVTPLVDMGGGKVAFGITVAANASPAALRDTLGVKDNAHDAVMPLLTKAALAADILHAGKGLADVTLGNEPHATLKHTPAVHKQSGVPGRP